MNEKERENYKNEIFAYVTTNAELLIIKVTHISKRIEKVYNEYVEVLTELTEKYGSLNDAPKQEIAALKEPTIKLAYLQEGLITLCQIEEHHDLARDLQQLFINYYKMMSE